MLTYFDSNITPEVGDIIQCVENYDHFLDKNSVVLVSKVFIVQDNKMCVYFTHKGKYYNGIYARRFILLERNGNKYLEYPCPTEAIPYIPEEPCFIL